MRAERRGGREGTEDGEQSARGAERVTGDEEKVQQRKGIAEGGSIAEEGSIAEGALRREGARSEWRSVASGGATTPRIECCESREFADEIRMDVRADQCDGVPSRSATDGARDALLRDGVVGTTDPAREDDNVPLVGSSGVGGRIDHPKRAVNIDISEGST